MPERPERIAGVHRMSRRRQVELGTRSGDSGLDCTVTRKGVGIEGRLIPWAEIDEARRNVMSSEPLEDNNA